MSIKSRLSKILPRRKHVSPDELDDASLTAILSVAALDPDGFLSLMEMMLPWEDWVVASGAKRLEEMSDAELRAFGVRKVTPQAP